MISHFRTVAPLAGALAVLAGLSGPMTGPARAAAPSEIEEHHSAGRLSVENFTGTLRIEAHHATTGIDLVLRGSAETLTRITREVRGDTLHIDAGDAGTSVISGRNVTVTTSGNNTTTSIGNNTVITQTGVIDGALLGSRVRRGRSRVVVNGVVIDTESQEPIELVVRVPQGTPLEISGMVGEVSIDDVDGWVGLELNSGRAEIDRIKGGNLALAGSGRIEIGTATGNLAVSVHGAGGLKIDEAELDDLDVSVAGAGDVKVAGVAERASVWVSGASRVSIEEVRTRPVLDMAGASRVNIGNW